MAKQNDKMNARVIVSQLASDGMVTVGQMGTLMVALDCRPDIISATREAMERREAQTKEPRKE